MATGKKAHFFLAAVAPSRPPVSIWLSVSSIVVQSTGRAASCSLLPSYPLTSPSPPPLLFPPWLDPLTPLPLGFLLPPRSAGQGPHSACHQQVLRVRLGGQDLGLL